MHDYLKFKKIEVIRVELILNNLFNLFQLSERKMTINKKLVVTF
jgi:hypothetical protein